MLQIKNMMDEDKSAMKRNHESRLAKKQTFHCVESHYHAAQTVYTESEKKILYRCLWLVVKKGFSPLC